MQHFSYKNQISFSINFYCLKKPFPSKKAPLSMCVPWQRKGSCPQSKLTFAISCFAKPWSVSSRCLLLNEKSELVANPVMPSLRIAAVPLAFYQKNHPHCRAPHPCCSWDWCRFKYLGVLLVPGRQWQRVKAPRKRPGGRREEIFQGRTTRSKGAARESAALAPHGAAAQPGWGRPLLPQPRCQQPQGPAPPLPRADSEGGKTLRWRGAEGPRSGQGRGRAALRALTPPRSPLSARPGYLTPLTWPETKP